MNTTFPNDPVPVTVTYAVCIYWPRDGGYGGGASKFGTLQEARDYIASGKEQRSGYGKGKSTLRIVRIVAEEVIEEHREPSAELRA